jgi:hypothetical protein
MNEKRVGGEITFNTSPLADSSWDWQHTFDLLGIEAPWYRFGMKKIPT